MLGDRYYLVFQAVPKKKAGFRPVRVETELRDSEIVAPDQASVPAAAK